MRNQNVWEPTKFVLKDGTLRAATDPKHLFIASRFVADILAREYQRAVDMYARGDLLDLGCGTVPLYEAYRHKVQSVTCVDWANTSHGSTYLDCIVDLNTPIGLCSETFDTVLLTDVAEHLICPHVLWSEMARVLRLGGIAIVGVPFLYGLHEKPFDYFRYTEFALRWFCVQNHLKVEYLQPYGGSLEVMFNFVAKHVFFSRCLSTLSLYIANSVVHSAIGRKVYNLTKGGYPLGYVLVASKLP